MKVTLQKTHSKKLSFTDIMKNPGIYQHITGNPIKDEYVIVIKDCPMLILFRDDTLRYVNKDMGWEQSEYIPAPDISISIGE